MSFKRNHFRSAGRSVATIAAALFMAAWIFSIRWYCWLVTNHGVVFQTSMGRVNIVDTRGQPQANTGWTLHRIPGAETRWWFDWSAGGPGGVLPYVAIPLWIPAMVLTVWSGAAWRRHIRVRWRAANGACVCCGYDLEGLPQGASCPECGAAVAT